MNKIEGFLLNTCKDDEKFLCKKFLYNTTTKDGGFYNNKLKMSEALKCNKIQS